MTAIGFWTRLLDARCGRSVVPCGVCGVPLVQYAGGDVFMLTREFPTGEPHSCFPRTGDVPAERAYTKRRNK